MVETEQEFVIISTLYSPILKFASSLNFFGKSKVAKFAHADTHLMYCDNNLVGVSLNRDSGVVEVHHLDKNDFPQTKQRAENSWK